MLEDFFTCHPYLWDKKMKAELTQRLRLEPNKIYKWNWERVRKMKSENGEVTSTKRKNLKSFPIKTRKTNS